MSPGRRAASSGATALPGLPKDAQASQEPGSGGAFQRRRTSGLTSPNASRPRDSNRSHRAYRCSIGIARSSPVGRALLPSQTCDLSPSSITAEAVRRSKPVVTPFRLRSRSGVARSTPRSTRADGRGARRRARRHPSGSTKLPPRSARAARATPRSSVTSPAAPGPRPPPTAGRHAFEERGVQCVHVDVVALGGAGADPFETCASASHVPRYATTSRTVQSRSRW